MGLEWKTDVEYIGTKICIRQMKLSYLDGIPRSRTMS